MLIFAKFFNFLSNSLLVIGTICFIFIMYQAYVMKLPWGQLLNGLINNLLLTAMYGLLTVVALSIGRFVVGWYMLVFLPKFLPKGHILKLLGKQDWYVIIILYFVSIFTWYNPGYYSDIAWSVFYAFLIFHFCNSFTSYQRVGDST